MHKKPKSNRKNFINPKRPYCPTHYYVLDGAGMDQISMDGRQGILSLWISKGFDLHYTSQALDDASFFGHIGVLNWWKSSGLKLEYTKKAINGAANTGRIDVLEWWRNTSEVYGLELKYDSFGIVAAAKNGYDDVLKFWKDNGWKIDPVECKQFFKEYDVKLNYIGFREKLWLAENGILFDNFEETICKAYDDLNYVEIIRIFTS